MTGLPVAPIVAALLIPLLMGAVFLLVARRRSARS